MAPVQLREPRPVAPRGPVTGNGQARGRPSSPAHREVTLLELLDRALDKGVVLSGDITLSVANVDLVYVGLRVLLCSIESMHRNAPALGVPPGAPATTLSATPPSTPTTTRGAGGPA